MGKGFNIIFTLLFVLMPIFLYAAFSEGGQGQGWTLLGKIDENEDDLKNIQLKIGKRKYTHEEERAVYNAQGQITSSIKIKVTDFEREIALKLLNLDTGATEVIKITKRGKILTTSAGYDIRVVKRRNGIEWNGRNTHFKVIIPAATMVIKIAWPNEATRIVQKETIGKNGKKITANKSEKYIENSIYSPYSTDDPNTLNDIEPGMHTPETSTAGAEDIRNIFITACQIFHDLGVRSRAFPQYVVCELPFLPFKAYQRLLLIEQMDESEFNLEPLKNAERVLVILRTNRNRAFPTCNSKKSWRACGVMQFTDRWRGKRHPGTYSTVVRAYPEAQLIKNFPAGAFDHVNAAMAAILLHDLNLNELIQEFGPKIIEKIMQDPVFAEMVLAAPYNGGLGWTKKALHDYFSGKIADWTVSRYLRKETRGYSVKLQYLIENDLP